MKIHQISYYDHSSGWQLEPTKFSDLNLLVGVSGVGKTKILNSIMAFRRIADGVSFNGVEWEIIFTSNNVRYEWFGKFDSREKSTLLKDQNAEKGDYYFNEYQIIYESLQANGKLIVNRKNDQIKLKGNILPKLSPFKSIVDIFSREEDIRPVKNGFDKIIYRDQLTYSGQTYSGLRFNPAIKTLKQIQEANLPMRMKLALAYQYVPEIFRKIKEKLINIFIQVEDIRLEPVEPAKDLVNSFGNSILFYMKEKGIDNWIKQTEISSGMFKTLMHISELYLSAEGSVILIDEFENSLGVNCIDILAEDLLVNRDLQFIITSHHPYIINKIGMEHWKIVTRRGGVVTVKDAKDFNLGNSRHESFMQLINLDAYQEGIAVE
jgi:predicted ATPase